MKTYSFAGDEALAWGAWEAGVKVASGYPGSPSTRFGDSSLFHNGLPAYMSAAASGARIMVVVLDNPCTAMTGCQGNPGTEFNLQGRKQETISMETVLKVAGVKMFRQAEAFGEPRRLAEACRGCLESE